MYELHARTSCYYRLRIQSALFSLSLHAYYYFLFTFFCIIWSLINHVSYHAHGQGIINCSSLISVSFHSVDMHLFFLHKFLCRFLLSYLCKTEKSFLYSIRILFLMFLFWYAQQTSLLIKTLKIIWTMYEILLHYKLFYFIIANFVKYRYSQGKYFD